jgi:predicted transposase/invertase (TIGR01784 family)
MKIRPMIDCVFKAILGSEENKSQLIHFLNSILELEDDNKITDVDILNPYNEKEFSSDKLTTVDLKARDQKGYSFQIDVQIAAPSWLKEKILYYWTTVYKSQLNEGQAYSDLKPTISIWLMENKLFDTDTDDPKIQDMFLHLIFIATTKQCWH